MTAGNRRLTLPAPGGASTHQSCHRSLYTGRDEGKSSALRESAIRRFGPVTPRLGAFLLAVALLAEAGVWTPRAAAAPVEPRLPAAAAPAPTAPTEPTEVAALRTESSKTFDNHDGTFTSELYSEPIFYKPAGSETWQPIELAFRASDEPGVAAVSERAPTKVSLARSDSKAGFLSLESGDRRISYRLPPAALADAAPAPQTSPPRRPRPRRARTRRPHPARALPPGPPPYRPSRQRERVR